MCTADSVMALGMSYLLFLVGETECSYMLPGKLISVDEVVPRKRPA